MQSDSVRIETAHALLEKLVGEWELTGEMGDVPLHQEVSAQWVLGHLFIEMRFRSTLPAPDGTLYEAIYHIGYNAPADSFVLHLLDTSGVATTCTVGVGRREGSGVPFVFNYASGPFTNRFIYDADTDGWIMQLSSVENGRVVQFALKRMVRKKQAG